MASDKRWCIHVRGFESWTWVAAILYASVIGVGLYQFEGKWVHIRPSPLGNLTFELEWAPDVNATAVECSSENVDNAPCYPFMELELRHVGSVLGALSFAPLLVTTCSYALLACCYHRSCRTLRVALRSSLRRWVFYTMLFLVFYAWYGLKTLAQLAARLHFDAADHITFSVVGLLVAFREASWVSEEKGHEHPITVAVDLTAWVLVLFPRTYFTYWTVRYFHTPLESVVGLAIGIVFFGCGFLRMTSEVGLCGARFGEIVFEQDREEYLLWNNA